LAVRYEFRFIPSRVFTSYKVFLWEKNKMKDRDLKN